MLRLALPFGGDGEGFERPGRAPPVPQLPEGVEGLTVEIGRPLGVSPLPCDVARWFLGNDATFRR